jgi:hypothetical protein
MLPALMTGQSIKERGKIQIASTILQFNPLTLWEKFPKNFTIAD